MRAPGSVSTQSLVTGVATAQPGHLQLVLARAPRTWPGLTRAGLTAACTKLAPTQIAQWSEI